MNGSGTRPESATEAAEILWRHWQASTRIEGLPEPCRPRTRAEGYAVQAEVARCSGQPLAGWKIAATSAAGQRHIGVDGPLAGRLLSERQLPPGANVPFAGNLMKVAEAEFAFRIGTALPRREQAWSVGEVLEAVASLHPAIEVPDSRYEDFLRAGAPQLIADMACACWFVIGPEVEADWRARDLVAHRVQAWRNGSVAGEGSGANVLGDPRLALTWIANELNAFGEALAPGHIVMTGTCVAPVAIAAGDQVRMDFGEFGSVSAAIAL